VRRCVLRLEKKAGVGGRETAEKKKRGCLRRQRKRECPVYDFGRKKKKSRRPVSGSAGGKKGRPKKGSVQQYLRDEEKKKQQQKKEASTVASTSRGIRKLKEFRGMLHRKKDRRGDRGGRNRRRPWEGEGPARRHPPEKKKDATKKKKVNGVSRRVKQRGKEAGRNEPDRKKRFSPLDKTAVFLTGQRKKRTAAGPKKNKK